MKQLLESDIEIVSKPKLNKGHTQKMTLRLGQIVAVYPNNNLVDIQWMFPQVGRMDKLELGRPYVGFQSGIHFVPQVGSLVTVGYIQELPILLTYTLPSSFSSMLSGLNDSTGTPMRIRRLQAGEISLNSVQDAEIYLHDSVDISDASNDSIVIDPSDGSITLDSIQLYLENEAGEMTMGMIVRNGQTITDDGQSTTTTSGGNALTELNISINQFADDTINSSSQSNPVVSNIIIGTVVDANGNQVQSPDNVNINLQVNMNSGIVVQFDANGNIFVNSNKVNLNTNNVDLTISGTTNINSNTMNVNVSGNTTIISNNINLNNATSTQGAARLNDTTLIDATTDPAFVSWIATVSAAIVSLGVPVPSVPISVSGEINSASSSVQIGG
jgi:hypothetical protein